jgi:hypothetical protein
MSLSAASTPRLSALAAFALLALSACKQDVGERCEIQSDCKSGLVCDFTNNAGGVCNVTASSGAGGTPGTGGSVLPDGGSPNGTGGSGPADANNDVVDAPVVPADSGDGAVDTSEAGGGDAADARDATAG